MKHLFNFLQACLICPNNAEAVFFQGTTCPGIFHLYSLFALLLCLASLCFAKQELHSAIQKYSEAVRLDPTFFDAYEGRECIIITLLLVTSIIIFYSSHTLLPGGKIRQGGHQSCSNGWKTLQTTCTAVLCKYRDNFSPHLQSISLLCCSWKVLLSLRNLRHL